MKRMLALGMGCALMFATRAAHAEHLLNFDKDKAGQPPQGWETRDDAWRVVDEPQAPSKPHVLMPPQTVLAAGGLDHLWVSSSAFVNGSVGVRFRTQQESPAVFGLLWGGTAAEFAEVQINTQSNSVMVATTHNGKTKLANQETIVFTPNTWHLLQVMSLAKQTVVYLDGEIVLTATTPLRKTPGAVGLSVTPNAPLQFDDFAWRAQ